MSDNKKWYKLVFKQIQPIHIGVGSYGVVNETRIFIPGWTMWGALTKAYNLQNNQPLSENQKLFENISCFYPCFNKDGRDALFPKFKNGDFHLGKYSEDKFRARFIDSFVSTAINPRSNTALDESLHELNIILPGVKADYLEKEEKKEKKQQLYWVGIIGFNEEDFPNEFLKEDLEIFIGGDARYGLGRIILENKEGPFEKIPDEWDSKDGVLKNYYPLESGEQKVKEGKIELLIEIQESWKEAELQVKLRQDKGLFYVPGSIMNKEIDLNKITKGILSN